MNNDNRRAPTGRIWNRVCTLGKRPGRQPFLLSAVLLTVFTGMVARAGGEEPRTWTDHQGRSFTGELISFEDQTAVIRRAPDGKVFHVPISRFSQADQDFLQAAESPETPLNHELVGQFLRKHCVRCHNDKKQEGKVRLDDMDVSFSTHELVYRWQDVLDVLNSGDMPPEDEDQPAKSELSIAIGEITEHLQHARQKLAATGGVIAMRHLSRREYSGSIRDLFHADLATDALPLDPPEGFDTDGSQQFFTANHYVMYHNVAERIVQHAIRGLSGKASCNQTRRIDPEELNNRMAKQWVQKFGEGKINIEDYRGDPDLKKTLMAKYPGKIGRIILPRDIAYLLDKNHERGASGRVLATLGLVPGYNYKLSVYSFGNTSETAPLVFEGGIRDRYVREIRFSPDLELHKTEFVFCANLLQDRVGFKVNPPKGGYVDYLEVEPLPTEPSPFEQSFGAIIRQPSPDKKQLREAFVQFCGRAFRRIKPSPEYIDTLMAAYDAEIAAGKPVRSAVIAPLATILTSPAFLYLKETSSGTRELLSPVERANRTAYFLTGAPADDAFLKAASADKRKSDAPFIQAVEGLLASQRINVAMGDFFSQWMELPRFDQVSLSGELLGQFSESVKEEPVQFFIHLIRENLPVDKLIDADFIVADETMARYYGLEFAVNGFERIPLPADSPRGGLLTQASFLMMGSSGPRTSPTIRGTIIRSKFLNDPPPPPPPNVPQLDTQENGTQTVRDLVKLHKEVAQCTSCHEKLDPIGFGLENFDRFGKFRIEEGIQLANNRGKWTARDTRPVVASGYLDAEHRFDDLAGLKQVLLQHKDELARSMFESLLAYGMGRKLEFVDEAEVDACLARLKTNNYLMKDLILEVIQSKAFKTK